MNLVRDRPEAKWLPSRHHFALARLVAFVILLTARPRAIEVDHIMLAVDRDQSAAENYAVAAWYLATMTCFVAALLPLAMPWALLAAIPISQVGVQLPIYFAGLSFNDRRVTSAVMMLCGATASLYFASRPAWARFPAYLFLGVLALNALAFVLMWLLRHRVRAAEERCAA